MRKVIPRRQKSYLGVEYIDQETEYIIWEQTKGRSELNYPILGMILDRISDLKQDSNA